MNSYSFRLVEFNEQLDKLKKGIGKFNENLENICEVNLALANSDEGSDIKKIKSILSDVFYEDGQKSNAVKVCLGIMKGDESLRSKVEEFNECKQSWKEYCRSIRKHSVKREVDGEETSVSLMRALQEDSGNVRLHHNQIKRELMIIEGEPVSLRYGYWENCKINKVSRDELIGILNESGDDGGEHGRELIDSVNDEYFACKYEYMSYRGNLVYFDGGEKKRKAISSTVPVVFINKENKVEPTKVSMVKKDNKKHVKENVKLEEKAWFSIGKMKIHRYKNEYKFRE